MSKYDDYIVKCAVCGCSKKRVEVVISETLDSKSECFMCGVITHNKKIDELELKAYVDKLLYLAEHCSNKVKPKYYLWYDDSELYPCDDTYGGYYKEILVFDPSNIDIKEKLLKYYITVLNEPVFDTFARQDFEIVKEILKLDPENKEINLFLEDLMKPLNRKDLSLDQYSELLFLSYSYDKATRYLMGITDISLEDAVRIIDRVRIAKGSWGSFIKIPHMKGRLSENKTSSRGQNISGGLIAAFFFFFFIILQAIFS